MPKVSVIVPNYNHAPFLKQRVVNILDQTYRDYELILLDDCSTDDSLNIIKEFQVKNPRIRALINERNSGSPFRQWDRGVLLSEGEYIWIAESDDMSAPDFLKKMTQVLEENRSVGLACCHTVDIDIHGRFIPSLSESLSGIDKRRTSEHINAGRNEIQNYLCYRNTIPNVSGVLFRKTAYMNAGLAYAGMRYCGDWLLYLRMLLDWDIAYVAAPLNFYRSHNGSSRHLYHIDQRYLEEVIRIYGFVMRTLALDSRTVREIRNQIAKHFCGSLKSGRIPARSVRQSMREIAPFLELNIMRFLANHFVLKLKAATGRFAG